MTLDTTWLKVGGLTLTVTGASVLGTVLWVEVTLNFALDHRERSTNWAALEQLLGILVEFIYVSRQQLPPCFEAWCLQCN